MRLLLVLGLLTARAWACSCMVSPTGNPPCQSAWQFQAVFTGVVTEITDPGRFVLKPGEPFPQPASFPQRKVLIKITEALTGLDRNQQEIVVETGLGGGDCGFAFERGVHYIVYASKKPNGVLSTGICSPTGPVEKAAEALKYFHQLDNASPTAEIRVTTFDAHGKWGSQNGKSELPILASATVTIDGPADLHKSATTDSSGRYVFSGLQPGEYKVQGSLEGYTTSHEIRPMQVHAKGCVEISLPLQLNRTMSGQIFAKDGRPAAGVTVEAVPVRPRQENELPFAADSATTDANGRYEMRALTTGDYYLGISLSRSPTLKNPYTRWFYPGSESPAAAGIVHVADKPEEQRFDLTLPDPQHDRVIQGTVLWPDGRLAEGVHIFVDDPRWPWQNSSIVAATTGKNGHFSVHGLDGTRYRLQASIYATETFSAEPVGVEPGGTSLDLKLVLTRKGYPPQKGIDKGLDEWRRGLGLR